MRDRPFRSPPPEKPEPRPCRACGIKLEWISGPKSKPGTWIPTQRVKAVYVVARALDGTKVLELVESLAGEDIRISHFEGCPQADEFSKKTRQKPHS